MMIRPRKSIPSNLYISENKYTFYYETTIKEFKTQLLNIPLGDTLDGPTLKDERRKYGHLEFTRVSDDGWIVTFWKEFEGSANILMKGNVTFVKTDGLDQSGKAIRSILTAQMMNCTPPNQNVSLEIKISEDRITERCQTANQISRLYKEQLLSKLEDVFNSGLFADFTLVVSGEELPAHKIILASSSKYFAALFKSNMIESQTNRLEVSDSKPSTIRAILEYIYIGQVTKPDFRKLGLKHYEDVDFYSDLLIAADKYHLDDLKLFCERHICQLVNEKSLDSLVILASRLNLDKLRKGIAKFASGLFDGSNARDIEEAERSVGVSSDFTLIVSGEEIRAHKNILAASSRYFAGLFQSDSIELQTDRLEVKGSKPSTIRAVLGYIYTGQVRLPDFQKLGLENYEYVGFYTDLLIAADKYQLDHLKSSCEEYLCNLVSDKSLESLVCLASSLKLEKLNWSIAEFASGRPD